MRLILFLASLSAVACGTGAPAGPVTHEHHAVETGAAKSARVEVDMAAGDLEMKSGAAALFEGDFDFNVPTLKPEIAYAVTGETGALKVTQGSASGSHENNWRLSLNETTPIDLDVKLSAGDANLVLGKINLRSLSIRLGAGDLTVDLRGMPTSSYRVNVTAGAGDTTIHLPTSVGVSVNTTSLITDVNVTGLEKRDGRWINPRAATSPVTIDLDVQHAVGDIRLIAE